MDQRTVALPGQPAARRLTPAFGTRPDHWRSGRDAEHGRPAGIRPLTLTVLALGVLLEGTAAMAAYPFALSAGVGLSEEFNDNVFFQADEDSMGNENDEGREWDFITHIDLGLTISYQRPNLALSLTGGTNINLYARQTDLNSIDLLDNQALQLGTTYQATSRLSFTISDSISRVSSRARTGGSQTEPANDTAPPTTPSGTPPTTPSEPPGTSEPGVVSPPQTGGGGFTNVDVFLPGGSVFNNSFGLSSSYFLTPRWVATVGYTNHLSDFGDPNNLDVSHSVSGRATYLWSASLSLNGGYSYSHFTFSDEEDSDADTHTVGLGAAYQATPTWSVSGSAGVFHNIPRSGPGDDVTDRTGFSGGLQTSKAFEQSSVSAAVRQGVTPSAGISGLAVSQQAFAYYARRLSESLDGSLGASFSNFDTSDSNFRTLDVNAGLGFPIWRNFYGNDLFGGLFYRYRWRDSDDTFINEDGEETLSQGVVDGHSVWFRVGLSFPLWQTEL